MLIDWFTVGAQFVNFLVLVALLKRFLYRPILNAMAARERRIAENLNDAELKKSEAMKELAKVQQRELVLENQKGAFLKQAADDAENRRKQLIAAARTEVLALQSQWQEALLKEKEEFRRSLLMRIHTEVLAITRRIFQDLADISLEEFIANHLIRRFQSISSEEKQGIAAVLKNGNHPIVIRSAFDMPKPTKQSFEIALRKELGCAAAISFETVPDLISGVEIITSGHKLSWNIDAHLSFLEKSLGKFLEQKLKSNAISTT